MVFYPQNVEELKNVIDEFEAISFDIWDTLITRTVLQPEDVFAIVENRANQMGIKASSFSSHRHEAVFQVVRANPNISEIYDALQKTMGISDKEKNILMQLEIQVESEVIVVRREMVEVLKYAVLSGKKVNLISDMYLPGDIMETFLRQLDIVEYDKVFISCDYRCLKKEGLYLFYKEKVQAGTYLHIGDNPDSDIAFAEKWGINAVLIKSGYKLLQESIFAEIINRARTHNERCMAGLLAACLFNSPFSETGEARISCCKDLGWLFVAPLISEFIVWLGNEMQKEQYDGILFAARDGYLIQKLYDQMKSIRLNAFLPKGIYFLTSRALCTQAGIEDEKDILWLASVKFHGSRQELLRYRFCLDVEDIMEMNGKEEIEYVLLHEDKILAKASENRRNYLVYMMKQDIEANKNYAFFDFVSSGTSQFYLGKFVPFKITGKYFCRSITADEKAKIKIDSLYVNDGVEKADSLLYQNYKYLETIMTSLDPSLRYIDNGQNAIYDEEVRNTEELQFVHEMHAAIEDYFKYFSSMCNWDEKISMGIAELLYHYMENECVTISCKTLDSMRLRDDWVREFAEK